MKANVTKIKQLEYSVMESMCKQNCKIKACVVEQDERENGVRAHLNFGHTIGHAIESASDFKLTHGACVALGMIGAFHIAVGRGYISEKALAELVELLTQFGFETKTRVDNVQRILEIMRSDKKSQFGTVRFVLPLAVGRVDIFDDVSDDEIISAIDYISL